MIWSNTLEHARVIWGISKNGLGKTPQKWLTAIIILPGLVQWGYPRWKMLGFYWTWIDMMFSLHILRWKWSVHCWTSQKLHSRQALEVCGGKFHIWKPVKRVGGQNIFRTIIALFLFFWDLFTGTLAKHCFFLINLSTRYPLNILHVVIYDTLCSHISLIYSGVARHPLGVTASNSNISSTFLLSKLGKFPTFHFLKPSSSRPRAPKTFCSLLALDIFPVKTW